MVSAQENVSHASDDYENNEREEVANCGFLPNKMSVMEAMIIKTRSSVKNWQIVCFCPRKCLPKKMSHASKKYEDKEQHEDLANWWFLPKKMSVIEVMIMKKRSSVKL